MMHLAHPAMTTTGRKKGRVKFASAEAKRRAAELEQDWAQVKSKWGVEEDNRKRQRAMSAEPLAYTLSAPPGRATSNHIPSRDTGHSGAVKSKDIPQYTGTKMLGIGTLHKSNGVPIFSDQEAKDISSMRR